MATGFQPRAGAVNIDSGNIQKLLEEIGTHITSLHLPSPDKNELLNTLAELDSTSPTRPLETGKVHRVLTKVLALISKAGETVITVGIKAYVEAWMKQHGVAP